MCLGVPLTIKEVHGSWAVGEVKGLTKEFRLDYLKNPSIGDKVLVHAGFAIEKISDETYREILQCLQELNEKMRELEIEGG